MKPLVIAILIGMAHAVSSAQAEAAPVLEGLDLRSGKNISLPREDLSKKASVIVFLSAACPCSLSHESELKKLAKEFQEFRFVGISSNASEPLDDAKVYFATFPFPVLRDRRSVLADEFKAVKTPHAFVVDGNGVRLFQGGVSSSSTFANADRKYLREALEDLREGREVRTKLVRALGCAIDRGAK